MIEHKVGTQEKFEAARQKLLAEEKELTRRGDDLARKRSELHRTPMGRHEEGEEAHWLRRHDEYGRT